jgi:CMP-2-keto-3-deoxyoctulosonic acid synthetase
MENGIPIYVGETPYDSVGVDTEEDLRRVIDILNRADSLRHHLE